MVNSFLSAEDKNFFSHPGVDAKGVLRALINNIKNIMNDRRLEGLLPSLSKSQKISLTNEISLKRKIKEAICCFSKELTLKKNLRIIFESNLSLVKELMEWQLLVLNILINL